MAGLAKIQKELLRAVSPSELCEWLALDVGCGSGSLSLILDSLGVTPVCVDISRNALWEGRMQGLDYLVRGSALALPFREGCFDAVFCIELLHHFTDSTCREALHQMNAITKENAVLLVDLKNSLNCVIRLSYLAFDRPYFTLRARNPLTMRGFLGLAGFGTLKETSFPDPFAFALPDSLSWLSPKLLYLARKNKAGVTHRGL